MLRTDGGGQAADAAPHKDDDTPKLVDKERTSSTDAAEQTPPKQPEPKPAKTSGTGFGSFES